MTLHVATRRALITTPETADAGWWEVAGQTCVAAYQPIGAASLAASYVNLANPGTYDCTAPVAAPTWDAANGWKFNGSTQYLTTGITNPASTWTIIIRITNRLANGNIWEIGQYFTAGTAGIGIQARRQTDGKSVYYNQGALLVNNAPRESGIWAVTDTNGYYNGSSDGALSVSGTLQAGAIYIGCANVDGSPSLYSPAYIQAVAIYSTALDAAQVAALTTLMAALS